MAGLSSSSSFVSQELGRKVLASFLDKGKTSLSEKVCKSIVDVLQAQPKLALEDFDGLPPLCWMIQFEASLEHIEAAYRVCPNVLKYKVGPRQELPLHMACRCASEEVVGFLVREYPKAVSIASSNAKRLLPIHVALQERPEDRISLGIIRILLRNHPVSVSIRAQHLNWEWMSPLEWAFYRHYPLPILELMRTFIPESMNEFWLRSEDSILSEELQVLARFLPQIAELRCDIASWSEEQSFSGILLALATPNNNLTDLKLWLPINAILSNRNALVNLSLIFENASKLKHVRLKALRPAAPYDTMDDSGIIEMITKGLRDSRAIFESMSMENFVLSSQNILGVFLTSQTAPLRLSLTGCDLNVDFEESLDWSPCRIEILECESCSVESFLLNNFLLLGVANMQYLRELVLWINGFDWSASGNRRIVSSQSINVTESIIRVLEHCPLRKLVVQSWSTYIDIEPVCAVLKENTTLKEFFIESSLDTQPKQEVLIETLEYYNTTLQSTCGLLPPSEETFKIRYWMLLNQCGRAHLRNEESRSLPLLIRLLTAVSDIRDTLGGELSTQLNATFGLLHECPDLWNVAS